MNFFFFFLKFNNPAFFIDHFPFKSENFENIK